jgi:hypothetical protein
MFCLLWSTILTLYSEDDVEGGIKIKKKIFFMKIAIFLGQRLEKR